MKPLLLTDLDDTLFQTARKMPGDGEKIPAALGLDGSTMSFMHPWQHDLAHWSLECMHTIPVTARGIESFLRVQLPFRHGAVCVHGAAILTPQGTLDMDWHAHMQQQLAPYQARLPQLLATALQSGEALGLSLRGWLESAGDCAVYVVIKSNASREEDLQLLLHTLQETSDLRDFHIHANGNNLALLPDPVNKRAAVIEVLRRHTAAYGRVPVFGMGDSLTDWGFMSLCDFAALPPHSQLGRQLT